MITIRLPRLFKIVLFTNLTLAWLSGISFYVLNRWLTVAGEFGPEKHFLQYPSLKIHGACAFISMVMFGALLFAHAPRGWHLKRSVKSGCSLVSLFLFQIITAYLLYYAASELLRGYLANAHVLVGLLLPVFVLSHHYSHKKIPKSSE